MKYFVANHKQYLNLDQTINWSKTFNADSSDTVIIAPPLSFLANDEIQKLRDNYKLSAQDVALTQKGAHTSSIGAEQLQGLVDYCIIGHSETRKEKGDTDQDVAKKANLLQKAGITPIICLDLPYLDSQIQALKHELLNIDKLIYAFEPASAIGSGRSENPSKAEEICFKIKAKSNNQSLPVLYGGSVDPENVHDFTGKDHIDGVLVGSASTDPQTFEKIIANG